MASPNTIRYAVAVETVPGTTDATPVANRFPHITGENLQYTSETLQSPVISTSGGSFGMTKAGYNVTGSLKTQFQRTAAMDAFLQSAMGNTYVSNDLKAGTSPISLTVEKTFSEGGVTYFRYFRGVQVKKFTLSVEAKGNAEASFECVGMSAATPATEVTGITRPAPASTTKLNGLYLTNMTIGGLTAQFTKVEFSVESDRSAIHVLGSADAVGIGTSGIRKTMISVTALRKSYAIETALLNDNPVAVSFQIGTGTSGYTFTMPAATCEVPQDAEDGPSMYVTLNFWPAEDATLGSEVKITKL